jgi:dihydroorotate dehydrogenase electron transfer subunit
MIQTRASVVEVQTVAPNLLTISFHAPHLAALVQSGQFINIKVSEYGFPLLRRPFSVYNRDQTSVKILFNVIGCGTSLLSLSAPGDSFDIIGPLGQPFRFEGEYETALLVGGGLGVAPLPLVSESARGHNKNIFTFLGGRTADQIVGSFLENIQIATDDGSLGFRGTVVDCLKHFLRDHNPGRVKIFGCGPTAMLKNLALLAHEVDVPCEVSMESAMACGIGICQGCPIELVNDQQKYALVCKDGTVFDVKTIRFA